jgi:hypothetical protein
MDKASVNRAIIQYNDHVLPDGARIQVNLPRSKDRDRSNSHASQSNYSNYGRSMYTNGRDSEYRQPNSRRLSVRSNQPPATSYYDNPAIHTRQSSFSQSISATPVEAHPNHVLPIEQLHSSMSEVLQKTSALGRLPMPLENIENRQSTNKKSNNQPNKSIDNIELMSQTGANNKENSPSKSGLNSQNATRPSGKKGKKGTKQNT